MACLLTQCGEFPFDNAEIKNLRLPGVGRGTVLSLAGIRRTRILTNTQGQSAYSPHPSNSLPGREPQSSGPGATGAAPPAIRRTLPRRLRRHAGVFRAWSPRPEKAVPAMVVAPQSVAPRSGFILTAMQSALSGSSLGTSGALLPVASAFVALFLLELGTSPELARFGGRDTATSQGSRIPRGSIPVRSSERCWQRISSRTSRSSRDAPRGRGDGESGAREPRSPCASSAHDLQHRTCAGGGSVEGLAG